MNTRGPEPMNRLTPSSDKGAGVEREYIDDDGSEHSNRREFIRRGAIALGVTAWTVPLVQMVRTHSHGSTPAPSPEQIGVQQITASCTTCVVECGNSTVCGSNGIFACICAPGPAYPLSACGCFSDVFCDEATPCTAGCPPGYACAQGCCSVPVCIPPCPDPPPTAFAAARAAQSSAGNRLTVTGKRL